MHQRYPSYLVVLTIAVVMHGVQGCGGNGGGSLNLDPGQSAEPQSLSMQEFSLSEAVSDIQASSPPAQVDPAIWEKLTSELASSLWAHREGKLVSAAPQGDANRVDLSMVDDGFGGFMLEWSYLNVGDYDRNGEVNVADITPIAVYFSSSQVDANWAEAQLADGDGNGEVNVADVTPIAVNYLSQIAAYEVQGSYFQYGPWDGIDQLAYVPPGGTEPMAFIYPLGASNYSTYSVVPVDSAGVEGVNSVLVTAGPPRLASPLALSEDTGFTDTDIEVVFSIGLAESVGVPIGAELLEVDSEGNQLAVLGDLWDDGDPLHGDEVADDSTLSAKLTINRAVEGSYYFRANITFDDGETFTIASNTEALQLLEEISDERIDEILAQLDVFSEQLDGLRAAMDLGQADAEMVELLLADPSVAEAGPAVNDEGVWYKTSDGIGCGISYPDPLVYGDSTGTSAASLLDMERVSSFLAEAHQHVKQVSNLDPDTPQSRKLLILDPFKFDFAPLDGGTQLKQLLTPSGDPGCKGFTKIDYFKNEECTWEKFADMSDYGAIIIISHGKLYHVLDPVKPWVKQVILTGTEIPKGTSNLPSKSKYLAQDDLLRFQSLKLRGGETRTYLAFDQEFLEFAEELPNSIIYMAVCHSAEYPGLANAFTARGARTVYGFDKAVSYPFAIEVCKKLFTGLLEGKDTSNVFGATPELGVAPYNQAAYTPPGTPNNHVKLVKVQDPTNLKQAWWTNQYVKVPINYPAGASGAVLADINNNGLVVGNMVVSGGLNQVAVWQINPDNTSTCSLVGPAMVSYLYPTAINDSGLIVGNYFGPYAFYSEGPDYTNLIQLDDMFLHENTTAYDVNNSGKMTGSAYFGPENDPGPEKAMTYQGGDFTDLGVLSVLPGMQSLNNYTGFAINNSSVIVGKVGILDGSGITNRGGFVHREGKISWLAQPASKPRFWLPYGLNDAGWAVGYYGDVGSLAYVWNTAKIDEHFPLPGNIGNLRSTISAQSINNKFQIVGAATFESTPPQTYIHAHAVLWEREEIDPDAYAPQINYNLYDLNCLLDGSYPTSMAQANDINELGQIIGVTLNEKAFIIVPANQGN